ncbi:MAG: twin-arginine translocation signal domain-containing protein, partial [Gemmatimonadaceae bacterium]
MSVNRRTFLKTSALLGGAMGLGIPALSRAMTADGVDANALVPEKKAPAKLKILILGGTGFIGPNQV